MSAAREWPDDAILSGDTTSAKIRRMLAGNPELFIVSPIKDCLRQLSETISQEKSIFSCK